jgi:hypothetical protein
MLARFAPAPAFVRPASRWGGSGTYEIDCEPSTPYCRAQDTRIIVTRRCLPLEITGLAADSTVILAEQRQLEAVTHLGVVAVGLSLEQVVPRSAYTKAERREMSPWLPVIRRTQWARR